MKTADPTPIILAEPVDTERSEHSKASVTHARINIPFNLGNWRHLSDDIVGDLAWLHQHAIEENLGWTEVTAAINYSKTVVFRVLKGTYEGNYSEVVNSIRSYRKLVAERVVIRHADFRETSITRLIAGGLSYAMANNSITTITSESRMGKTETGKWWRDHNNHGRTVFCTVPTRGGARALLRELSGCLGISRNASTEHQHEAVLRAFNPNRFLLLDEAHRLLPKTPTADPILLEIVRDIHDRTKAGLGLLCTRRFEQAVSKSDYQFEQILGRIGMPVRLPRVLEWEAIQPIVEQYLPQVPKALREELLKIANSPGRLGILCETLKFASRIAVKTKSKFTASTIQTAIATRTQMMGEQNYAKK